MVKRIMRAILAIALVANLAQAKKLPVYNETDQTIVVKVKGFKTSVGRGETTYELRIDPGKTAELNFKPRNLNKDNYFQSDLEPDDYNFYSFTVYDTKNNLLFEGIPTRKTNNVYYAKRDASGKNSQASFDTTRPGKILHSDTHDSFDKNLEKGYGIHVRPIDSRLEQWQDEWQSLMQYNDPPKYPQPFSYYSDQNLHVDVVIQADGVAVKETVEHIPTASGGRKRNVVLLHEQK